MKAIRKGIDERSEEQGSRMSARTKWTVALFLAQFIAPAMYAQARVRTTFEEPIRDANYPELMYWFITPETFAPGRVEQDVQHIAKDTYFTFPFLTERNGVVIFQHPQPDGYIPPTCPNWPQWCTPFAGNAQSHALMKDLVRDAHQNGLKIGITFDLQIVDTVDAFLMMKPKRSSARQKRL